jgi:DNA repair protein RadD
MVGRGARLFEWKSNCLVLDFTNNTKTHGPVDLIDIDGDGNVKTSPYRVCPQCGKLIEPKAKACECGYSFERECHKCHSLFDRSLAVCPDCGAFVPTVKRKVEHSDTATDAEILSSDGTKTEPITDITVERHKKEGKRDSVKVTYYTDSFGMRAFRDWLCFDHGGYALEMAKRRWLKLGGKIPTPRSVDEALSRSKELEAPKEISVKREGKYWRVV